ncbi:MAG: glucose-6-phosphate isomerase [Clostridia bacterium]|nr:glucose-6-phosphate isomerase [Clostridia bacterium]
MLKEKIRFDYNNMTADFIGEKEGVSDAQLDSYKKQAEDAFNYVKENSGKGMMGWTELAYNQDEIVKDIVATAENVRKNFKAFVVLGIGGSALGPIAVFQALKHLHYNELDDSRRNGPKFYVEDNVDPERMNALLDIIDVKNTMFNVITKSGATSETMSQYLIITDILKKALGDKFANNVIATTDIEKGNLIKLAKKEGFKTFYIPSSVGGRFSELCPVGLLPAAVLGIDIATFLEGAKFTQENAKSADFRKNAPLCAALLQYISMQRGKNVSVMMPYADSLKYIADWYCQLWGESLGKAVNLKGETVNVGQTPVKSLGVTDQHSQVQLYAEGPYDKVITFIAVDKFRSEYKIPEGLPEFPDVNFLCGNNLGKLLNTERVATEYALTKKQKANRTIYVPEVNEFTLGQLLMFFMLETAYTGALLGIDTFNQPGVEEGKKATFALFDRRGYEEKKAELQNAKKKENKYII